MVTAALRLPRRTPAERDKIRRGIVTIQVTDRRLDVIFQYLSRRGNVSLVVMDDTIRDMRISLDVRDTNWLVVLGVLAQEHGLQIDESRIKDHVIMILQAKKGDKTPQAVKPIPPVPKHPLGGPGLVSVQVVSRRLGAVLDYLARVGKCKLVTVDGTIRETRVTIYLDSIHWRVALEVIAKKYNLDTDESRMKEGVLVIKRR